MTFSCKMFLTSYSLFQLNLCTPLLRNLESKQFGLRIPSTVGLTGNFSSRAGDLQSMDIPIVLVMNVLLYQFFQKIYNYQHFIYKAILGLHLINLHISRKFLLYCSSSITTTCQTIHIIHTIVINSKIPKKTLAIGNKLRISLQNCRSKLWRIKILFPVLS